VVSSFRNSLAQHFYVLVRVPREAIFREVEAQCRPINLPDDASTMFAGYVGKEYTPSKGVLLLAINPGGGGDSYTERTPEDEDFYPLLKRFKAVKPAEVSDAFEQINLAFVPIVKRWNLWRILEPTLAAAGKSIDQVAYMNVVPYRTRGDKMPPAAVRRAAWRELIEPTIELLHPRAIITLGKKAGSVVDALYTGGRHLYCVPRTIGDSWVSDAALEIHDRMRAELSAN
jgi:hypothetical protein